VLVGATLERGVDDVVVNRVAVEALRARAAELVGALRDAPEVSAWAGVRPGTVDDAPMIGESAVAGVHVALGMYRNGVLLAPAVGEAVAASVLDAAPRPPFNPGRFHR
jgi:glycine oxidase